MYGNPEATNVIFKTKSLVSGLARARLGMLNWDNKPVLNSFVILNEKNLTQECQLTESFQEALAISQIRTEGVE